MSWPARHRWPSTAGKARQRSQARVSAGKAIECVADFLVAQGGLEGDLLNQEIWHMLFAGVGGATVLGINFLTALVTHPGAVQPDRCAHYALGLWSRPSQLRNGMRCSVVRLVYTGKAYLW